MKGGTSNLVHPWWKLNCISFLRILICRKDGRLDIYWDPWEPISLVVRIFATEQTGGVRWDVTILSRLLCIIKSKRLNSTEMALIHLKHIVSPSFLYIPANFLSWQIQWEILWRPCCPVNPLIHRDSKTPIRITRTTTYRRLWWSFLKPSGYVSRSSWPSILRRVEHEVWKTVGDAHQTHWRYSPLSLKMGSHWTESSRPQCR
jgi:hypothetical protein